MVVVSEMIGSSDERIRIALEKAMWRSGRRQSRVDRFPDHLHLLVSVILGTCRSADCPRDGVRLFIRARRRRADGVWGIQISTRIPADRAAIPIGVGEFGPEPIPKICGAPVAQVQSLVLLDQSPLEAVDRVSFQESLVLGGAEWTARTASGFRGEVRLGNAQGVERGLGLAGRQGRCEAVV